MHFFLFFFLSTAEITALPPGKIDVVAPSSEGLMKEVSFSDINLFIDSQVVSSWTLACKPPKRMSL